MFSTMFTEETHCQRCNGNGYHPIIIGTDKDGAPFEAGRNTCCACEGSGRFGAREQAMYWALAAYNLIRHDLGDAMAWIEECANKMPPVQLTLDLGAP